jgi:putative ABC transport system permease protein
MTIRDVTQMAFQALGKNKIQTMLTTLGIVIGVSAVIAMVSVGQGASKLVQDQMSSMGTNVLQIMPAAPRGVGGARGTSDQSVALTDMDVDAIQNEVPTVKVATPVVTSSAQIIAGNQNWQTRIEGANERYLEVRDWQVEEGSFFTDTDVKSASRVAVLGKTVTFNLFGDLDPIGQTIRVRNMPYRVVGVLTAKGQSAIGTDQDDVVMMPYTTVQKKLLGQAIPSINRASVSAIDSDSTGLAQQQITDLLRQRHKIRDGATDDFRVNNLTEVAEAAQQTTLIMTLLLGSIAAVSLVVGGIGIMNIMLVSVTERTREIGIRMAIGSRGSYIRLQFLAESVMLCMFGGVIGVVLGAVLSWVVGRVLGWPTLVSIQAAALAFSFAAATGIFFGYYPARKAASLDPIEALRYEYRGFALLL